MCSALTKCYIRKDLLQPYGPRKTVGSILVDDYVLLAQLGSLILLGWNVRGYVVVEVQSFQVWSAPLSVQWLTDPA